MQVSELQVPDMKMSGDAYFSKNNLMDFKLISTLGLTKDDLAEVRKTKRCNQSRGFLLNRCSSRKG